MPKIFYINFILFIIFVQISLADNKIQTIPLINLEELSPTFEEEKSELEKKDSKATIDDNDVNSEQSTQSFIKDKIYINLTALDKITAKTSTFKVAVGDKKFFGPLEIVALKCQLSKNNNNVTDTIAYLQVKDLSNNDNNQVFLFNGWTFASSPTLKSIDHPVYDLWIVSCDNI